MTVRLWFVALGYWLGSIADALRREPETLPEPLPEPEPPPDPEPEPEPPRTVVCFVGMDSGRVRVPDPSFPDTEILLPDG